MPQRRRPRAAAPREARLSGIAVLDIDGVLADVGHRLHHLAGGQRDWSAFFAAADEDPPLPEGLAVAAELERRGLRVVYLSGRPEELRATTEAWLRRHGLPDGDVLLRPAQDRRPARVLKLERLRALGREGRVVVLVDDDADVVAAVRASRPPAAAEVLLAEWGEREPGGRRAGRGDQQALRHAQEVDGRT